MEVETGIPVIEGFPQHMARCQRASAGNRVSRIWEGPGGPTQDDLHPQMEGV